MVLAVVGVILSMELGPVAPSSKLSVFCTILPYWGSRITICTWSTSSRLGGDCMPVNISVSDWVVELYTAEREELENSIRVASVCLLMMHRGTHALPVENITVLVVRTNVRIHHFLKLSSTYMPALALYNADFIFKVRLEMVDTLPGLKL